MNVNAIALFYCTIYYLCSVERESVAAQRERLACVFIIKQLNQITQNIRDEKWEGMNGFGDELMAANLFTERERESNGRELAWVKLLSL